MFLGVAFGFILKLLMNELTKEKKLILISGVLIFLVVVYAIILIFRLCFFSMILGITYRNAAKDEEIFDIVDSFTPPVLCFFFCKIWYGS
ncbi:MAG: hypothetical protein L6U99_08400 [Clostridium sp.]|nr:MAG: hypothetical protein L6U99_08400 [Clostridium sp.]